MVATEKLQHPMIPSIAQPLKVLTASFYRLRFGQSDNQQPDLEMSDPIEHARQRNVEVKAALEELTHSVDLMMVNAKGSERAT
jgi:hypothetical protein